MLVAESLVIASPCRSCALRCYMRTLIEYAYVLCKISGPESLDLLEEVATLTLSSYAPMPCIDKVLEPLVRLKRNSDIERDLWINQLLAEDAIYKHQLH